MRPSMEWMWRRFERVEAFRALPESVLQPLDSPDLDAIRGTIRSTDGSFDETLNTLATQHGDACVRYTVSQVLRVTALHLAGYRKHAEAPLEGAAKLLEDAAAVERATPDELLTLLRPFVSELGDEVGVEFDDERLGIRGAILGLPAGTDPFEWARFERLAECVRYTARAAIGKSVQMRDGMIGDLLLSIGVHETRRLDVEGETVELSVREIEFREHGIYVVLLIVPDHSETLYQRWSGFDLIQDGAGAGYIEAAGSSGGWSASGGMRTRIGYFSGRRFVGDRLILRAGKSMIEAMVDLHYPGSSRTLELAPVEFDLPVSEALAGQLDRIR